MSGASWRAKCFDLAVRALVRRRAWGEDDLLTRRARRVFGSPRAMSGLWARGLGVEPVRTRDDRGNHVRGEWLVPPDARPGTLLYFHGGGYISCSPLTHRPITTGLARLTGRRVLSADYRLAPEHPFPAAADDAFAAYRWLAERTDAAEPIVLAGDSAGGGLVLTTLVRARDEGVRLPAGAVCFSPWTDLSGAGDSIRLNEGRCAMFMRRNIPDFASVYLRGADPRDPRASPVFADLSGLPPVLIQVGATELLLDDARLVHQRILESGGSSRLEIFDGVFHVWQMLHRYVPEARVAMRQAADFIVAA